MACLGFIDTEREKEISIGVDYPFDPLEPGECLVPTDYKDEGIKINDTVTLNFEMGNLLRAMTTDFNNKTDPAWRFQALPPNNFATVFLECKVVDFLDGSYGKYAEDDSDDD